MTFPNTVSKAPRSARGGRNASSAAKPVTLADVDAALKTNDALPPLRRRDLRSSLRRVARLLGQELVQIPLDLPTISRRLAGSMPAAVGLTEKSFANIKSDFLAALRTSGVRPSPRPAKTAMSPSWRRLTTGLSSKRMRLGLSRLAFWCSQKGIEPEQVSDAVLAEHIEAVRQGTLHRKPNELYRDMALIWNEVAQNSRVALQRLTVPSFRRPAKRLDWASLPHTFRSDHDTYLTWCAGGDVFAADARSRALAAQTVKLQHDHVHAAVTALVESGIPPKAIRSLGDLVTIENFKRILRRRHEMVEGRENVFNRDLTRTLIEIARRWVKVSCSSLTELEGSPAKYRRRRPGLRTKNKATLRQFDDPSNLRRLVELPDRLWAEVRRDKAPNFRTVLKAQAALAIGMLCYMPIRPQNLSALKFNRHVFLHEGRGAVSSLELSANEVKNRTDLAFDIPATLRRCSWSIAIALCRKLLGDGRNGFS